MYTLSLYTIYDSPSDYPGKFPVRRFEYDQPKELLGVADSLEAARKLLPPGLAMIHRAPGDDPAIVETWL